MKGRKEGRKEGREEWQILNSGGGGCGSYTTARWSTKRYRGHRTERYMHYTLRAKDTWWVQTRCRAANPRASARFRPGPKSLHRAVVLVTVYYDYLGSKPTDEFLVTRSK